MYNPSKTISVGVSLADSRASSHRTSKSWSFSFCRRMLNRSDNPCAALYAPVLANACRSHKLFAFLVRIGRTFEHAALQHSLFVGSSHACREAFSMEKHSTHQAYRSQENLYSPQSIAMFLGALHCEMIICGF